MYCASSLAVTPPETSVPRFRPPMSVRRRNGVKACLPFSRSCALPIAYRSSCCSSSTTQFTLANRPSKLLPCPTTGRRCIGNAAWIPHVRLILAAPAVHCTCHGYIAHASTLLLLLSIWSWRYIEHLVNTQLHRYSLEHVVKQMRKLRWEEEDVQGWVLNVLLDCACVKYALTSKAEGTPRQGVTVVVRP